MKGFFGFVASFIFVCALLWGISLAVFGLKVATAGLYGSGEAHIIKESAPNRIVQQAGFETAWADVRKYDKQVTDARRALADWDQTNIGWQTRDNAIGTLATQRAFLAQVLTGLVQQCQITVETYNADARKYLAKDFRAADLPESIDINDHCR